MNKLILILALSLTFSFQVDNGDKTLFIFSTPLEQLNGHVKQMTEVNTDHIGNWGVANKPSVIVADFDKKSDMVQMRIGESGGEEHAVKFNTNYNSDGKRATTIGNSLIDQETFKYDDNERITKRITKVKFTKNPTNNIMEYKYDTKNDLVEIDILDLAGKISVKYLFKYDEKHHLASEETAVKGQPALKTYYQYQSFDQRGNWVKKIKNEEGLKDTITRKITYY